MRKNRFFAKLAAFLMAAVLVSAQGCPVFATEEQIPEEAAGEELSANVIEEQAGEEAVSEDAATEEPAAEETVVEEPAAEETPVEDPAEQEPPVKEIITEEPVVQETVPEQITAEQEVKENIDSERIHEAGGDPIPVGAKINLKEQFGFDSDYKNVKFSITSGKNLAVIEGSTLTAKKAGDIGVKATYKYDGEKGEDETGFTIYPVGFKKKNVTVSEKGEYDAAANLKTETAEGSPAWSSSSETVATIDSSTGKVNILAGGTTVISASYSYGNEKTKVCKFKLVVKLPGLKVSSKNVSFGGVFSTPLVNVPKGTDVSWYLDTNETRAEWVDQTKGKIKIIGMATEDSPVYLHAQVGSEELTAKITTTEPSLGGLPKNYDEMGYVTVKKGKTRKFSVKGIAKGVPLTWTSSDEDTVSVSKKGQVKSKQYGSATITATVEGYGDLSVDIDVPDPSDQ